jgi:nucleoside-diphosphate-sugar epimerase
MKPLVLITGASGFVGSHLTRELLKKKWNVRLLLRENSTIPVLNSSNSNVEIIRGDIRNQDEVEQAVNGVHYIFHLAAVLKGKNLSDFKRVNVEGTKNLCRAFAKNKNAKRFVYISSLAAAGPATGSTPLTENDFGSPISFYGQTKWLGEQIVLSYRNEFASVILRPGIVYGPYEKDFFNFFKMMKWGIVFLPGNGEQRVSVVFIDDLIRAIVKVTQASSAMNQIFFIAENRTYTWNEIIQQLGRVMNRKYIVCKIPWKAVTMLALISEQWSQITKKAGLLNLDKIKEARASAWIGNPEKMKKLLSFQCEIDLNQGLSETLIFYQQAKWI